MENKSEKPFKGKEEKDNREWKKIIFMCFG